MKKILIILLLLLPVTAFALQNPFGSCEKPVQYMLLDPIEGFDFVFAVEGSNIQQVGVINYFEYQIITLKKNMRAKSTLEAGDVNDPPDQRLKILQGMISEMWPGFDRIKYYRQ